MNQLSIINSSLLLVGANPLVSLADENKAKRVTVAQFPVVRDMSLRAHPWNFATRRVALTVPDSTAPIYGFTYRFALPSSPKCLRVLEVEDQIPFSLEENYLCCDSSTVNIKYIVLIEDTTLWDESFTNYFIHKLAAKTALNLMQNVDMHDRLDAQAERFFTDAKFINAVENNEEAKQTLDISTWLNSRIT